MKVENIISDALRCCNWKLFYSLKIVIPHTFFIYLNLFNLFFESNTNFASRNVLRDDDHLLDSRRRFHPAGLHPMAQVLDEVQSPTGKEPTSRYKKSYQSKKSS